MTDSPSPLVQLVGAGFGRTGTLSLKAGLELLGFGPCHHMMEVMSNPGSDKAWLEAGMAKARGEDYDWASLLAGYRAVVDWPGCSFWREFADAFPAAPVLLSVRDPERWYESAYETIYQAMTRALASEDPAARARMQMPGFLVLESTFHGRFEDRAFAIGVYEAHNEEVRRAIPKERLLVYEVGQGWEPLCGFLGVPVPEAPFPHVNSRDEFKTMLRKATESQQP